MRIVICNGTIDANYLIETLGEENNLTIINSSAEVAKEIMARHHRSVFIGKPWRHHILMDAGVADADVLISLCEKDTDNFAVCYAAKHIFHVKNCICMTNDPNNVEIYKKLGIDTVICSTYVLGNSIKEAFNVESVFRTMTLQNNKIAMIEAGILSGYEIAHKRIMDIAFPRYASISCIFRDYEVIIPNGQIVLLPGDKLYVVCAPKDEKEIREWISCKQGERGKTKDKIEKRIKEVKAKVSKAKEKASNRRSKKKEEK